MSKLTLVGLGAPWALEMSTSRLDIRVLAIDIGAGNLDNYLILLIKEESLLS